MVTSTGGTPYLALRPLLSGLRAVDAPRRRRGLSQGRGADRRPGRHLPGRARGRGGRRLRRADLLAAAGGRRRGAGRVVRAARGLRRGRPRNVERSSASRTPPGDLVVGDLVESPATVDARSTVSILDMLAPVGVRRRGRRRAASPGGSCARTSPPPPSSRGSSRPCATAAASPSRSSWESLVRDLARRGPGRPSGPSMIGHTAFLVTARRTRRERRRASPAAPRPAPTVRRLRVRPASRRRPARCAGRHHPRRGVSVEGRRLLLPRTGSPHVRACRSLRALLARVVLGPRARPSSSPSCSSCSYAGISDSARPSHVLRAAVRPRGRPTVIGPEPTRSAGPESFRSAGPCRCRRPAWTPAPSETSTTTAVRDAVIAAH